MDIGSMVRSATENDTTPAGAESENMGKGNDNAMKNLATNLETFAVWAKGKGKGQNNWNKNGGGKGNWNNNNWSNNNNSWNKNGNWNKNGGKKGSPKGKGKDVECFRCGKKGHIARDCKTDVKDLNALSTEENNEEQGKSWADEVNEQDAWGGEYEAFALLDEAEAEQWQQVTGGKRRSRKWKDANHLNKVHFCKSYGDHCNDSACGCVPPPPGISQNDFDGDMFKESPIAVPQAKGSRFLELNQIEEDAPVMVVEEHGRWTRVIAGLDSCAAEHVAPKSFMPRIKAKHDGTSRTYVAANGSRLDDLASKKVNCKTQNGLNRTITFRNTNVMKPLVSVGKLTRTGHKVRLEDESPHVKCPNGDWIPVKQANGIFVIELWFDTAINGPVFSRPE